MAATKRYFNWTGVAFTPSGGTLVPITGVTSVAFDKGGSLAKFSGDGDRYNTTVVNDFNEPSATVTAADEGAIDGCGVVGTFGVLTATHNDAKNGAGASSFARTYSLNCVIATSSISGQHRQFGAGTISFDGISADGVTNPLSITIL